MTIAWYLVRIDALGAIPWFVTWVLVRNRHKNWKWAQLQFGSPDRVRVRREAGEEDPHQRALIRRDSRAILASPIWPLSALQLGMFLFGRWVGRIWSEADLRGNDLR